MKRKRLTQRSYACLVASTLAHDQRSWGVATGPQDVELEDLRKEMVRLRKQLAMALQSTTPAAPAPAPTSNGSTNPLPKAAKNNAPKPALVTLVTDSCAQGIVKPAMPKLQLVHI